ncbi:hypothetical protein WJX81_002795 [Elliptochloris bilobata]|uniref:CID domain-containing protein n=1 Tax=Elliptochloris bilobata TaxID=381761 RepID=A0AAW1RQ63_9CHLO
MADDAEFVALYASELADLTINSKPVINTLTMLAAENLRAAPSIAAAIERHVATCPPKHKLPALYLVDSIAKNVGQPFIGLFAQNLPQVYATVWQAAPETRNALEKLRATWHGVFADAVLASVARAAQGTQAAALPAPQRLPAPYPAPAWQQPAALEPSPSYGAPAVPPANGAYYGAPTAPVVYGPPQPAPQQPPVLLQPLPVQYALPQQQQQVAYQPQPAPLPTPGLIRVPGGDAKGSGAAGGADARDQSDDEDVPRRRYDPEKLKFLPERIKAADPTEVAELQRVSAQTRSGRLDRAYLHRRRMRGQGGKGSRAWYVNEAAWLAGTTADATAAPKFFQEEEAEAEAARAPEPSVPVDDEQPACALSGERFETFWDDLEGQWRYRGVVRLDAEQAARYGLEEGALARRPPRPHWPI